MPIELTDEAKLKVTSVVGELFSDAVDEVLSVGPVLVDGFGRIFEAISPEWDTPGIWADRDVASPIMLDLDYSAYSGSFTPGSNGIIAAETVSKNTAGFVLAGLVVAIIGYFGFKQAGAITGKLYAYFFGLSSKISGVSDQVSELTDLVTMANGQPSGLPSGPQELTNDDLGILLKDLKAMLEGADSEISALITALASDNTALLKSETWSDRAIGLLD